MRRERGIGGRDVLSLCVLYVDWIMDCWRVDWSCRFLVMRAEGRKYGILPAEIAADLDIRMGGES